jgi:hypothetical protein
LNGYFADWKWQHMYFGYNLGIFIDVLLVCYSLVLCIFSNLPWEVDVEKVELLLSSFYPPCPALSWGDAS